MDDPHAEVEVIPQLKPRGSMAKEEDPKPSHQLYSYRLNPHDQLGRLSMEYVKDHRELPPKKHTSSDSCGHWRQEHTQVGPDENLSTLIAGAEISTVLEDILRR